MKKIFGLLLMALFFACSSSSDNDDEDYPDKRLIGKWRVEYSQYISDAKYDEVGDSIKYTSDILSTIEYFGNYGEPGVEVSTGLFYDREYEIKIEKKSSSANGHLDFIGVKITTAGANTYKMLEYKIEDGYLIARNSSEWFKYKYYFENNKLIIIQLESEGIVTGYGYRLSRYRKIK